MSIFFQGDFFETLLYKIFVSIDENTTVAEVSCTVLASLKTSKLGRRREAHLASK